MTLTKEKSLKSDWTPGYQWALPENLDIPPDELKLRLDFYANSVMLQCLENGVIRIKMVSARDVALAMLRNTPMSSGLLPKDTLWWSQGKEGAELALWRKPMVWPVALLIKPGEPPKRFKLPMPGLIFICCPSRPPRVFAAKSRPTGPHSVIYHAPLFNVYASGQTCAGTHTYPGKVEEIPESFFFSFFTIEAEHTGRSKRHPDSLFRLWEELDGKKKYPTEDLEPCGKVGDLLK